MRLTKVSLKSGRSLGGREGNEAPGMLLLEVQAIEELLFA